MGIEIERKFLVATPEWRVGAQGVAYRQGYLARDRGRTVRVRIAGTQGFLTIKGPPRGIARAEFEYPVPLEEAQQMLTLCEGPLVEKVRFRIPYEGLVWEVDEFEGANAGLIVAEIELPTEDTPFSLPPWVGKEVTDDPRYANSQLSTHPFSTW